MRGRPAYLTLAAAAALLASGCGDDDNAPIVPVQTPTEPPALNQSDFIEQADAICGESNAALANLGTGPTAGDAKLQATQQLEITRSELESLQSLTPPDQDRATLDQFLSALKDEVDTLSSKQDAVNQGGDTSTAEAELTSAEASALAAASDYGFKNCAKAGGAPSTATGTTGPATTTPTTTVPTTATPPAPAGGGTGTGGGGTGTGGGGGGGGGGSGGVSP